MPKEQQHICVALHNIDVVDYLLGEKKYSDWAACVTYYCGLHIVDAVFSASEKEPSRQHGGTHERRRDFLKYTKKYEHIFRNYSILSRVSHVARYIEDYETGDVVFFDSYMSFEDVREKLVKHHLWQIIKSAGKYLSSRSTRALTEKFNDRFGSASSETE